MPDREKVIKGLEAINDYFFDIYRNDTDSYKCEKAQEYSDVAIDALAMLKEQEPKPVKVVKNVCNEEFYFCPNCDRQFYGFYKRPLYCDRCGQAVKWE